MRGILFASFGTTHLAAREGQIDAVAVYIQERFPDSPVYQAYTSNMVMDALKRRGIDVPNVSQALTRMADEGISEVILQPSHILPGWEYNKVNAQAEERRGLFRQIHIGQPLLASTEDLHLMADILCKRYPARVKTAVVFMGHGTDQFANMVYAAMDYRFKEVGRSDIYVGTVEAHPTLESVMQGLARGEYDHVLLAPLMLVAGDHAVNDMAGDEPDSWASRLRAAGYEVSCDLTGLGEIPDVKQIYVEHILAAGK